MKQLYRFQDDLERQVVGVWRAGHLSSAVIAIYLRWTRHFRKYCKQNKCDELGELTQVGALRFVDQYVGVRKQAKLEAETRSLVITSVRAWACALRAMGMPLATWLPQRESTEPSPLIADYCKFRRAHCGVAEGTVIRDIETADGFIAVLKRRRKSIEQAGASEVDAFVGQLSKTLSIRSIGDRCSSLRAFLRFLRATGRLKHALDNSVVAPRVRVEEKPPRALRWSDVRRILQAVSRSKRPGKRDFAMLLLMASYGLGAAEVLSMQIEDINWQSGILCVRRPKTGVRIELPLLPAIAKALSAYLRAERPSATSTRRIFVGLKMPYPPITSGAIRHRIRHYAKRAGIEVNVIGAHAFRHSHASRQIDGGANLKVVSDILGHRRPSSTSVYVRVAIRRLRLVALPVPR
jgi:site-specific recombinase XerD